MLQVEGIEVVFGTHRALAGVELVVEEAQTVAVLGPSGCGKSTLLRVIAGLQLPAAGRVLLDGRDLAGVPAHRRGVGLVFQDHALFPHLDVGRNVAFGLRMRGSESEATSQRVTELLTLVGLQGYERRSVATLSGGEQQRVALARALAPGPRVLLLDEPLGSLDRPLRERLLEELAQLFRDLRATVVYVTHDRAEALVLGDRVAVMRAGSVVQCATPDELWAEPADEDVARFLGIANVLDGRAIRPEAVRVRRDTPGNALVVSAVREGATVRLRVQLDGGEMLEAIATELDHPAPGERVTVTVDPAGRIDFRAGRVRLDG